MRRIIGPVLGALGILLILGLVAGIAYSAGLGAAGVIVAPGATTAVVPAAGPTVVVWPWFGFGHILAFFFVVVLVFALLRAAFGVGRHWGGAGWGPGYGYGYGYGPGSRRGRHGWDPDHDPNGSASADSADSGDPREAWIRARLEEWHTAAHARAGGSTTAPTMPPTDASTDPSGPPPAAG